MATTTPDLPLWADHARGAFANVHALVVLTVEGERRRRRLFLSLDAAEKAARRARGRGEVAVVVLVQLRPVVIEEVTP